MKKILEYFYPRDFKDDLYGWQTNQISHCAMSVAFCYLFSFIPYVYSFAISFWFLWETRHLIKSKNIQDFFEDLTFEIGGVLIILFGKVALISLVVLFFLFTYIKYKKWQ